MEIISYAIVVSSLTGSGDSDFIASNDNDLLSGKELLGDNTGQTTKEVVTTVDNFSVGEHHGSSLYYCISAGSVLAAVKPGLGIWV